MATKTTGAPLATPRELADFLGVPVRTLGQWRYLGKGPTGLKVGRHIRYRWDDVEKWLDQQSGGGRDHS